MKFETKKVIIAGGTGFLGYYSALMFLDRKIAVDTIALPNEINLGDWYPKEINIRYSDLFAADEEEIYNLFKDQGYDTLIYALGPDDRVTPNEPAYNFFRLRLVEHAKKICLAAKRAGIRRCVVLNSYFAYFDRLMKGELAKNHPYIKARVEQAAELIAIGERGIFDVMILELPYIFGAMPGREPLWKKVFLDRFDKMPSVYFPNGGTSMIHARGVAEAVVAAACNGDNGERYPVGNVNVKFKDMINIMMETIGSKKRFVSMPAFICAGAGWFIKMSHERKDLYSGLDYVKLMTQIQSKDFYFDPSVTQRKLGYDELGFTGGGDIAEAIRETMRACYPERFDKDGNLLECKQKQIASKSDKNQ